MSATRSPEGGKHFRNTLRLTIWVEMTTGAEEERRSRLWRPFTFMTRLAMAVTIRSLCLTNSVLYSQRSPHQCLGTPEVQVDDSSLGSLHLSVEVS